MGSNPNSEGVGGAAMDMEKVYFSAQPSNALRLRVLHLTFCTITQIKEERELKDHREVFGGPVLDVLVHTTTAINQNSALPHCKGCWEM